MSYVLENEREFERLERQSRSECYDYRKELEGLLLAPGECVLDAGCGSGIVTRYLAERFPKAKLTGCDLSADRVALASKAAARLENVDFRQEDLEKLSFEPASFGTVVCRYVLQHLRKESRNLRVVEELFRVLKPGGVLCAIDSDGLLMNLHPMPPSVQAVLDRMLDGPVDFYMGRKLPALITSVGFRNLSWRVETVRHRSETHSIEIDLMRERLEGARAYLAEVAGSASKASCFVEDYLQAMQQEGAVYFLNRFIVTGVKPLPSELKIIK